MSITPREAEQLEDLITTARDTAAAAASAHMGAFKRAEKTLPLNEALNVANYDLQVQLERSKSSNAYRALRNWIHEHTDYAPPVDPASLIDTECCQ
jgi:hypothetical protein